ncbi:hypothetical protein [Pseudomonas khavaziana]|uniref:hypothetical protein n=1 Tax=Pseudomonas khavaziana TaxID=2842351 RepID=UPI001C3CAC5B|nr:hypothetical protein [Pseudomonas khavaziana]MBV4481782.1 hypothetical protein [Pseudomonas khavaziana]
MTFALSTDPHELEWLETTAICAHCDISANGEFTQGFGVRHKSTVSLLLAETKHASLSENSGKLLPLLGALSAMDQFGTCYDPFPPIFPPGMESKSSIIKSAHNFLNISVNTPDSDALYALRNSLMHQSSLISVGTQRTPKHYWFEINNTIETLFKHAETAWDGEFNTRNSKNRTMVNASKVLNLAFTLTTTLKEKHEKRELKLVLPGGLKELLTTYVELTFDISFRASYLAYLGEHIYRALNTPAAGSQPAKTIVANALPKVVNEAAILLAKKLSGAELAKLQQAYPTAMPKP